MSHMEIGRKTPEAGLKERRHKDVAKNQFGGDMCDPEMVCGLKQCGDAWDAQTMGHLVLEIQTHGLPMQIIVHKATTDALM